MLRLLVSAGGTGGGVYPALAVVAALGARAEVLWVGSEGGMEASLVSRADIDFESIPAAGVHGVGARRLPMNLLRLAQGFRASRRILRRYRPDAILLTGGYVGVPVSLAGGGIPKAVYVPDIEPGLALRLACRLADVVTVTAEETRRYLPAQKRIRVTGYPARPDLKTMGRVDARRSLGLVVDEPVLLVFGGSRGARSINTAIWDRLPDFLERAQLVHIIGELDWPKVHPIRDRLNDAQRARYHAFAYLHDEMGAALAAADLAVARAGASTLGELPLFALPSVLVPYPHAWRYQAVNAAYLESHGAAVVLADSTLGRDLLTTVTSLLQDAARLDGMSRAARGLARPDAAQAIAGEVERLAQGRGVAND
jgi:UDP-N-acetylglucosamine--N-acetylmuramyl-(pentapeptide) pyrophosphoryl-undecaprenol N-acetylglucosamine transferase